MFAFLLLTASCSSKTAVNKHTPESTSTPKATITPQPTDTALPTTSPVDTIEITTNEKTKFVCSTDEFSNFEVPEGWGMILDFENNGTFRIAPNSSGGYYYYGRFQEIEANLYSFYGEVLDYSTLERCFEGEECFVMPSLTDESIDGYLKLENNLMYYIPYHITIEDLRSYSSDTGCKYLEN